MLELLSKEISYVHKDFATQNMLRLNFIELDKPHGDEFLFLCTCINCLKPNEERLNDTNHVSEHSDA